MEDFDESPKVSKIDGDDTSYQNMSWIMLIFYSQGWTLIVNKSFEVSCYSYWPKDIWGKKYDGKTS